MGQAKQDKIKQKMNRTVGADDFMPRAFDVDKWGIFDTRSVHNRRRKQAKVHLPIALLLAVEGKLPPPSAVDGAGRMGASTSIIVLDGRSRDPVRLL